MSEENRSLILDLVEWIAKRPRRYCEVMEAWRSSCPRLTIWEDAVDQGLVVRHNRDGTGPLVSVTEAGMALLRAEGRLPVAAADLPPDDRPDRGKADRA
ncbi:MAG TPA: hypothetical protein VLA28_04565 [Afifellaceae bacterium]|nr:hypothetical protein [Afifellaceae bacterium]